MIMKGLFTSEFWTTASTLIGIALGAGTELQTLLASVVTGIYTICRTWLKTKS